MSFEKIFSTNISDPNRYYNSKPEWTCISNQYPCFTPSGAQIQYVLSNLGRNCVHPLPVLVTRPHLCRGIRNPDTRASVDCGCLRTGTWWLSSSWPDNRMVKSLATQYFIPYWTRWAVRLVRSDQSAGRIKP